MQYTNLANTGLKVSRICLGCMTYGSKKWRDWVLEEPDSRAFFERALEFGINFFDTADAYSGGVSEEILGRALKDLGVQREKVVIATKVFFPTGDGVNQRGLSRKHIRHAIEASLRRLQLDYVDVYQIHRFDPTTPIEETMEALADVIREGKALFIGASSMHAYQFAMMQHAAELRKLPKFVTMQNHYNMVYREEEREMNPYCVATGVGLLPWSPLARGLLAGTWKRGGQFETDRAKKDDFGHTLYGRDLDFDIADRAAAVAERLGVKPAQVALAWLLKQPGVTAPIVGASKMYQLEGAARAVDLALGDDDIRELSELYQPRALAGHA